MADSNETPRHRVAKRVGVVRTERLSESMVRVVVGGDALAGFDPQHADSYVKLCFPTADADRPRTRTYTVRSFDAGSRQLTLDVVVHGDHGLAGPWAAKVRPGDEIEFFGPGGGYTPAPEAAFHLLAGDESALPAIANALEQAPAGAAVRAFVEVYGPSDEIELARPEDVIWLHRGTGAVGSRLVEAVTSWTPPADPAEGHWFVHGEAGVVKALRRHLRVDLGVTMSQLSISGYWRLGADDEGWRAVKREFNADIEASEAALAGR